MKGRPLSTSPLLHECARAKSGDINLLGLARALVRRQALRAVRPRARDSILRRLRRRARAFPTTARAARLPRLLAAVGGGGEQPAESCHLIVGLCKFGS